MPIDPNISLQGKPVQFDSAGILNMFQQGQALRMQRQLQGQQMQLNDQRIEEGKAAVQKSQIAARDQQTIQGLYLKNNGDPDATVRDAIQAGASTDAVQGLQQHAANIREKNAKADADELGVKKYHNEQMLGLHKTAIDLANSEPQAYAQAWPQLYAQAVKLDPTARQHLDPNNPPTVQQLSLSQAAYGTDEYLRKEEEAKRQQNAESRAAQMQPLNVEAKQGEIATGDAALPGIQAKSDIEAASAAALKNMTTADWANALDSTVGDKTSPLYKRTASAIGLSLSRGDLKGAQAALKDAGDQLGRVETGVATAKATAPIKIDVAAQSATARSDAAGLTDDDYKRSGEQFARTGIMPAMGRDSITRGKIAHEANQWARDNGFAPADIVTMQAAYAGDKESLKKFQAQRDQIVSFEQTAQKNLDLFIGAASKIPDTGLPWLNMPIRMLDQKLVGSANMAAVNAARQVANNEIAKVTSGGGLGGVVSDSARHEVESYNPKDATFAQTLAVAKMLKQDMANRHQSMDASLSDIKQRIGGGAPQAGKPEKWGFDSSGKLVKQ